MSTANLLLRKALSVERWAMRHCPSIRAPHCPPNRTRTRRTHSRLSMHRPFRRSPCTGIAVSDTIGIVGTFGEATSRRSRPAESFRFINSTRSSDSG
jgi:hypothetical protein